MRASLFLTAAFILVGACGSNGSTARPPVAGGGGGATSTGSDGGGAGGSSGTGGAVAGSGGSIGGDGSIGGAVGTDGAAVDAPPDVDAGTGGAPVSHEPAPATGFVEMNLYSGDPPNLLANAPKEMVGTGGQISNVSVPTLRRYPLDESKMTGTAFVVFPGGGYSFLDMEVHATAIAQRLGPMGIAVFGLKYRVGGGSKDVPRDALLDAKRAIRLLRSKAAPWGLAPNRIGVISYSAGSHLDMNLVANFDSGQPTAADPVERLSSRPDFVASMCTWSFGSPVSPFKFTAAAPPVYMCHAQDDTTAPIALAQAIDQQLKTLGVLEHLEVYPTGGHSAFHVADPNAPGRNWLDKYLPWLTANQLTP